MRNAFFVDTVHTAASDSGFNLTVRRNCSISPRDLSRLFGAVVFVSFGIAAGFACVGAWMILPFAGLEMLALAAAFCVNGRHATDYERIALAEGRLVVEQRDVERLAHHEFNPAWVRVSESRLGMQYRLLLRSHGTEFEIGRHLSPPQRVSLGKRLRARLVESPAD